MACCLVVVVRCTTSSDSIRALHARAQPEAANRPYLLGTNCQNTTDFLKAANMDHFQTLLYGCQRQLSTYDMDYDSIDYGFSQSKSFKIVFASWSTAEKAGVLIGIICAGGLVCLILIITCCCCCG